MRKLSYIFGFLSLIFLSACAITAPTPASAIEINCITATGGTAPAATNPDGSRPIIPCDKSGIPWVNINAGGGSGGTASTFGAAFPGSGTAIGQKFGANMVPLNSTDGTSLDINCVTGCAGGTFNNNADNVATSANNGRTAAFGYVWDGGAWDRIPGNSTTGMVVNVGTVAVTGTFFQATQPVSIATAPALVASSAIIGNVRIDQTTPGTTNGVVVTTQLPAGTNNIGDVDILTIAAGNNNIGDVDVATVPADPFGVNADAASVTGSISAKLRAIATALGATALDLGTGTGGSRTLRTFQDTAQWVGGAGVDTAAVQRMSLASNVALPAGTNNIGDVDILTIAAGNNNIGDVDVASSALPTLAATSTKQSDGSQKTQIVDGSGNVIASTSNNLNVQCANCSGSGASAVDAASFTASTSVFGPSGGFFQTTATANALTNGQQGMVQMTANRAYMVNLRNAAGAEVAVAAVPLQVSLANTATNATAVKVDGSAVTQPVSGTVTVNTHAVTVASGGIASGAVASGAVASGAYASGSIAVGAITDGADVALGAKADSVCGTATGTCSLIALVKYQNNSIIGSGTAGSASTQVVTVQGIASMTPILATLSGTNNIATVTTVTTVSAVTAITNALPAGTNLLGKVGIDQTTNGTTNAVVGIPATTGGLSWYFVQPAASDNHVVIKAGAGQVYNINAFNNSATVNYLRLYNATTGFNGCNSATNLVGQWQIPASTSVGGFNIAIEKGLAFATGISICITSGYATTDTTNATATAMSVNIGYK